jgi:carboxypeptidase family protein
MAVQLTSKNRWIYWIIALILFLTSAIYGLRGQQALTNLAGTVSTEDGEAVSGVELVAESETGQTFRAVTNEQGRFLIPNLPPGRYHVKATIKDVVVFSQEVTLKSGASQSLEIKIHPRAVPITGVIRGTVKNNAGAVIMNGEVAFQQSGETEKTTTDVAGAYRQEGLYPGVWQMTVTAKAYKLEKRTVRLAEREESVQDFVLKPAK